MKMPQNVIAFPRDTGELPPDRLQEIRDTGFTHYRRADGDLIEAMAILRAACLILCDLVMGDPDPMAALDTHFRDLRNDTEDLIVLQQD